MILGGCFIRRDGGEGQLKLVWFCFGLFRERMQLCSSGFYSQQSSPVLGRLCHAGWLFSCCLRGSGRGLHVSTVSKSIVQEIYLGCFIIYTWLINKNEGLLSLPSFCI